jgi:hypothetical protein
MFAEYTNDVTKAWISTIISEYEKIRDDLPLISSLKIPNFIISNQFTSTLGEWDERNRTITLAEYLVKKGSWDDIIDTLKHEMAHQIVSEIFGIHDESPHGDAFKRACKILGIVPTACGQISDLSKSRSGKIFDKIRKLLALGESPVKHEAELALAKAHELSLKYNIDLQLRSTLSRYGIRLLGPIFKRMPSYIWGIMRILNEFYFVQYIRRPCQSRTANYGESPGKVFELYGLPENLDLAEYVYYFLLHHGELEWQKYKQRSHLRNNRKKISFLDGLYDGFRESLAKQHKVLADEKALAWLGDSELEKFYRQRNPRIRYCNSFAHIHHAARAHGTKVGEDMRIRPGLRSQNPNSVESPKLLGR